MKVTLLHMPETHLCATAASMCYKAPDGYKAMVHAVKSGHESVLEHCSFTFHIEGVSRVLLAQLTRHRLASYSVESQRYCGVGLDFDDYVIPETIFTDPDLMARLYPLMEDVQKFYKEALFKGVPDEDARFFTFQAAKTQLVMTMNARELRHFFSLRCCNRAQWEIRQLADEMLSACRIAAPHIFNDAGPGCVRGACPEGKKCCGKPRKELIVNEKTDQG